MIIKVIVTLFIVLTSMNANATTIEGLIKTYGKRSIMDVIAFNLHKKFTINVNGTIKEAYAPNPDYITAWTLKVDIERAGMSVKSVENIFLERAKQAKAEEKREAEANRIRQEFLESRRQKDLKRREEDLKILSEASESEKEQFRLAQLRGMQLQEEQRQREELHSVWQHAANRQAQQIKPSSVSSNPISEVNRSKAEADLKAELLDKYGTSYSLIETLLNAGMKSYDTLVSIPDNSVNNSILRELKGRYYPSFSLILTLYESNKKAYDKLNSR